MIAQQQQVAPTMQQSAAAQMHPNPQQAAPMRQPQHFAPINLDQQQQQQQHINYYQPETIQPQPSGPNYQQQQPKYGSNAPHQQQQQQVATISYAPGPADHHNMGQPLQQQQTAVRPTYHQQQQPQIMMHPQQQQPVRIQQRQAAGPQYNHNHTNNAKMHLRSPQEATYHASTQHQAISQQNGVSSGNYQQQQDSSGQFVPVRPHHQPQQQTHVMQQNATRRPYDVAFGSEQQSLPPVVDHMGGPLRAPMNQSKVFAGQPQQQAYFPNKQQQVVANHRVKSNFSAGNDMHHQMGQQQPVPVHNQPTLAQHHMHGLAANPTPPLTPNGHPHHQQSAAATRTSQDQWVPSVAPPLGAAPHLSSVESHMQQQQPVTYQQQQPAVAPVRVNPNQTTTTTTTTRIMPKNHAGVPPPQQAQMMQNSNSYQLPSSTNGNPSNTLHHQQHHAPPPPPPHPPSHHLHQQQQHPHGQPQQHMLHQQHHQPPHQHQQQQHHHHHHQPPSHPPPPADPPGTQRVLAASQAPNQIQLQSGHNQIDHQPVRLTLPLLEHPILGPFKLEHDVQSTSKVFHLSCQIFDKLMQQSVNGHPQRSSSLMATAPAIKELQFGAFVTKQQQPHHADSLLANQQPEFRTCNWPDLFQVSINQNMIHLDRTKPQHRPVDVFQLCQPGDNVLDIQVNDCYCAHEFVIEAIDRPTLKAFMDSCYKYRLLCTDSCIQKLKFNFGSPGFLVSSSFNEYITEYLHNGLEQTRVRVSIKCPISARRMRTPTRGRNCKHLQCFDLETFLHTNRDKTRWNCPLCSLAIPFNMLELDQHLMSVSQAMSEGIPNTDDILMDSNGHWQAYYPQQMSNSIPNPIAPPPPSTNKLLSNKPTASAISTYHPETCTPPMVAAVTNGGIQDSHIPPSQQAMTAHPMRPMSQGPNMPTPPPMSVRGAPSQPAQGQQMMPVGPPPLTSRDSPLFYDNNCPSSQTLIRRPPSVANQPQSQQQQQQQIPPQSAVGRRSANGSPLLKKPYIGQYSNHTNYMDQMPPVTGYNNQSTDHQVGADPNCDQLSPLAAMERTIIQHEQQMGPPPFDPNNLGSSTTTTRTQAPSQSQIQQQQQQQHHSNGNSPMISQTSFASSPHIHMQNSPDSRQISSAAASSPAVASPARIVPASPQQRQQQQTPRSLQFESSADVPQSPRQRSAVATPGSAGSAVNKPNISISSTPGTPMHGAGPETPATPGCNQQQQQHLGHSPHVVSNNLAGGSQQATMGITPDHQPMSNGSASAGSITSSSTMTPSTQSLGSVGMGGDSRCGTASLSCGGGVNSNLQGVEETSSMTQSASHSAGNKLPNHHNHQHQMGGQNHSSHLLGGASFDDDATKLLLDSVSDGQLVRGDEIGIALDEADWKRQLDRGKSEHLANFLNEPLIKKQHYGGHSDANGETSNGLNQDDVTNNLSRSSSPGHNNTVDQLEFAHLLDADTADDNILDLFER